MLKHNIDNIMKDFMTIGWESGGRYSAYWNGEAVELYDEVYGETTYHSLEEFEKKVLPEMPNFVSMTVEVKSFEDGIMEIPDNIPENEYAAYAMQYPDEIFKENEDNPLLSMYDEIVSVTPWLNR